MEDHDESGQAGGEDKEQRSDRPEEIGGGHEKPTERHQEGAEEPDGRVVHPRKRGSRSSSLRDPEALAKLEAAAEHAGLSLEGLVDLVADSGALTLPSDGLTQRFTVKELGIGLWTDLQKVAKDERPAWYGKLTPVQRRCIIVACKDRGFSSYAIGKDLGLTQDDVMRVWSKHADELGAQVVGMRLTTIAGQLHLAAERAQNGAMEKGDNALFWRIAKDVVKIYSDLGIVDRATHKIEVTHKFDEEKQVEIAAMVELEEKKKLRIEEIKRSEDEVVEDAPQIGDYDS